MKFAFIADMVMDGDRMPRECRFPVKFMCEMLGVSRQGYYAWVRREPSKRKVDDEKLTEMIKEIHEENKRRYGIDRIHRELARRGVRTGPQRVRRLARAAGLSCVHPRPYKVTTVQDEANGGGLVDLVGRDFFAGSENELWYGDITYIWTLSGWAYLATVIDGFSRRMVGWAVSDNMREELVTEALRMAVARRRPEEGQVIFHSDRGSQYTGGEFRGLCLGSGIIPSVGKTGVCYDNAAAEAWNAIYKKELIHLHVWRDAAHVRSASFEFIEVYYNRVRIQKELGYLSPVEYESEFDKESPIAA